MNPQVPQLPTDSLGRLTLTEFDLLVANRCDSSGIDGQGSQAKEQRAVLEFLEFFLIIV